jgi:hypothetical protein
VEAVGDAERYLERAEQLERIAREVFLPEHRRALLEVARDWRQMAAQVIAIEQRSWAERGASTES